MPDLGTYPLFRREPAKSVGICFQGTHNPPRPRGTEPGHPPPPELLDRRIIIIVIVIPTISTSMHNILVHLHRFPSFLILPSFLTRREFPIIDE